MAPPEIRETDHPLWIWARGNLWGAAGALVMLALAGALYLFGSKDDVWFSVLLTVAFLAAALLAAYVAYKATGKNRPR